MKLLVIRHATAEGCSIDGSDRSRELTERGVRQADQLGAYLVSAGCVPDLILASPYRRACETARLVCRSAGIAEPVIEGFLGCGMCTEIALTELSVYDSIGVLGIVGHNPDLSMLLAELLAAGQSCQVKPGSVHVLEGELKTGGFRLLDRAEFGG